MLRFWTDEVHVAAWIVIWFIVIAGINLAAVSVFGEFEVVCSTIKFSWIFVVIISLIGMFSPIFLDSKTNDISGLSWRCRR